MDRPGFRIHDQYGIYFLTFTTVGWIDVFTRKQIREILLQSLKYCIENKGLVLYAYVVMSNHLHLIARSSEAGDGLSAIVRDFKKFTSISILDWMDDNRQESRRKWMQMIFKQYGRTNPNNTHFQFWQQSNMPKLIVFPKFGYQKLNYIHVNPVRAGYVDHPADYPWSSYRAYYSADRKILLPVEILHFGSETGYVFIP